MGRTMLITGPGSEAVGSLFNVNTEDSVDRITIQSRQAQVSSRNSQRVSQPVEAETFLHQRAFVSAVFKTVSQSVTVPGARQHGETILSVRQFAEAIRPFFVIGQQF